ncbi:MAG: hypothetical protein J6X18_12900 [Bacteroidales bacterium]|nr:hypothetical protein [Bacteroidales bacterium]
MKTPKEYTQNLKNGIVTLPMLSDAIYTYNKRAKNMRDKAREYRRTRRWTMYDYYGDYCDKRDDYYKRKEELLEYLEPQCVHIVEREDWDGFEFNEFYIFYDLGNHSFHTPIKSPKDYPNLPVENSGDLETFGEETAYLMSVQTADRIRNGLANGTLKLEKDLQNSEIFSIIPSSNSKDETN